MKSRYLDYRDYYISVFHDNEKYLMIFVNDEGATQVINYDSNFFTIENLIDAFYNLINESFRGLQTKELKNSVKRYYKHLLKQGAEIEKDYISTNAKIILFGRA